MEMMENKKRGTNGFHKRLKSMLAVDFRRMFTMPLLYIMVGISAVIPILVLVMTTTMSATADPATGIGTEVAAFTNVWQAIASVSGEDTAAMSLTSMCNINLLYFWRPFWSASLSPRILKADIPRISLPSVRRKPITSYRNLWSDLSAGSV